jgi:hypothetical protein
MFAKDSTDSSGIRLVTQRNTMKKSASRVYVTCGNEPNVSELCVASLYTNSLCTDSPMRNEEIT